jgi:hypothetical protein
VVVCLCPRCSRLGSAVIGCDVNGYMLSLGDGVKDAVALTSAAQDNSLLYVTGRPAISPAGDQRDGRSEGAGYEDDRGSADERGRRRRPMGLRGVKDMRHEGPVWPSEGRDKKQSSIH